MYPHSGTISEDLLAEGDRRMYQHKQDRKQVHARLTVPLDRLGVFSPLL
jgi:hypothetical protein